MKTNTKLVIASALLLAGLAGCSNKPMATSSGGVSTGDPRLLTARSPGWTGVNGPTGQGVDPTKELPKAK